MLRVKQDFYQIVSSFMNGLYSIFKKGAALPPSPKGLSFRAVAK